MFLRALFCCTLVVIDLQIATPQLSGVADEDTEDQGNYSDEEEQAPQGEMVIVQHPIEGNTNQSPIPAVPLQEVQRLAASLQNEIRNQQDRDQKDAQFALSMVAQYPQMTVIAQNDLYNLLKGLLIAAQQPQQQPQQPQQPPQQQPNTTESCEDSAKPKLLICEYQQISISDISTNDNKRLNVDEEFEFYYSLDYHFQKSLVIYSYKDYLFWGHLWGTDTINDSKSLSSVDGYTKAVVDWVHDKVYFATQLQSTVKMADLDGANVRTLFDEYLNAFPDNLAVDPYEGYLFFVSIGYIYRSNLEGNELKQLQLEDGKQGRVRDLTLDIHKKRLYYAYVLGDNVDISQAIWNYDINDGKEVRLASCSYDGLEGKVHPLTEQFGDMRTMQVFRGTVYFANYAGDEGATVWSADLAQESADPVEVYSTTHSIDTVKVYHPSVQKQFDEVSCP